MSEEKNTQALSEYIQYLSGEIKKHLNGDQRRLLTTVKRLEGACEVFAAVIASNISADEPVVVEK